MDMLQVVVMGDIDTIRQKEKTYKGSWKKRGGMGAFMMLARKWDRLENILEDYGYDVFKAIEEEKYEDALNGMDGTVLAEIRDLRRYLILVEAEMVSRNRKEPNVPGTPEDGGHHARQPFDD